MKKDSEEGINLFIIGDTEAERGFELTTFRVRSGCPINYATETYSVIMDICQAHSGGDILWIKTTK